MSLEKKKKRLYEEVNKIRSLDILKFTTEALSQAPKEFWVAPSSSSGKHHPPEDQGRGGLVTHTIKSIIVAKELLRFYSMNISYYEDLVISAMSLHDILKNGKPWGKKTDYRHGYLAYEWLKEWFKGCNGKEEILNAIRYHMSRWVVRSGNPEENERELLRATNPTTFEHIVQLSDYIASRKSISFQGEIK